MIAGFSDNVLDLGDSHVAYSIGGEGPPVLLLHGFPQTRALWAHIGPKMAPSYRVIAPDLRGYGDSGKPPELKDYSFREMGNDLLRLMDHLGHDRFHLIGHDRGARTAHRMALDAPDRIASLQLLDIIPTHHLLSDLQQDTAHGYYHWFFLAQPKPFPERLIATDPDYVFESFLVGWGAGRLEDFDAQQLDAYRKAWRDPDTIQSMCNDYRAALKIDMELDAADLSRTIACPTHILWGKDGLMGRQYDVPATWQDRCAQTPKATAMPGGHFFPDTAPDDTAQALMEFLSDHNMKNV